MVSRRRRKFGHRFVLSGNFQHSGFGDQVAHEIGSGHVFQ